MIQWLKHSSKPEVAKYIECYWLIEKEADSESFNFPKLNPDPSAHLIISPDNQSYHYDMNPSAIDGKGTHWLFPHHQTLQLDHSKPFVHLGVKFQVGALYSFKHFAEQQPTLDCVEQVQFSELFSELITGESVSTAALINLARSNPNKCCNELDRLFLPWALSSHEDAHSQITRKAVQAVESTPISDIGKQLYCSQRTLERSFNRVTGLTLKQCQSMKKLEAMLEYLYQRDSADIDWVEIAFQFGFSDQPHLIRYLKKQIGITPKVYEKQRGLTIDVYGGVSSV
ncbi:helix-turn-helix domain-containing protein [Vibrio ulleungensis]|uniref:Helix-turn-helix transcriptional regulator n=1 Tax=Vibrio ulleungensis TaxID=2807619 RepID=A0ABS2HF38_9VIBR|nr:AraC family transcriptional regulator [Vibrio ulleungensis]MBM7035256.1 helix-turn-helix transcriptional regulator [Vibrio ulleungensis]